MNVPLLSLCHGLAFFLYGMMTLSSALKQLAGSHLERILQHVASGRIRGLLLGAGLTVLLQSSSALTVMLVGLVDAGIMELHQTIGIIMGSNIGTTLTAWLLALTGIESDTLPLTLFHPQHLSPVLALAGVLLSAALRHPNQKNTGHMLMGFSMLLWGMDLMAQAASPLADTPIFAALLSTFQNPVLGLLAGTVFTAVIQSSAASIGMLQALALVQPISYVCAIPVIMGQNIGTCATALLSSVGVSRRARQVAVIHLFFNLIGALFGLTVLLGITGLFPASCLKAAISPVGIALCHTLFNLGTTLLLLPFPAQLEFLAKRLVPISTNPSADHVRQSPALF